MGWTSSRPVDASLEGDEPVKEIRITAVEIVSHGILRITWNDAETYDVDISDSFEKGMEAISKPRVFSKAHVGEFGLSIDWPGDIGIGADTLYCDSLAQAGKAFPTADFNTWMKKNRLSLSKAADVLGMSRRMIAYYNIGAKPIPKHVGLACRGYEAILHDQKQKAA